MKEFLPKIKDIAERLIEKEKNLKNIAKELREKNDLVKTVNNIILEDVKIVGVDGGIVKKVLHGFDLILVRAVGVCFHYQKNRVRKVDYFPSKIPTPHVFIFENLSEIDLPYSVSIIRQKTEIDIAIKSVEKFRPHILLLDGSIVPHYADKPTKDSYIYEDYKKLVDSYKELYKICMENKVLLAGIVEDSRGTRFCDIVKEFIKEDTRDTNLLFWMLKKGERTKEFSYCEDQKKHPVLMDFDEYKIKSFYIKTADMDRPVRVDFIGDDVERIASIVFSLSAHHSSYGIPSILIEADHVAKLSEEDAENFYKSVTAHTGLLPCVFKLRREMRPF